MGTLLVVLLICCALAVAVHLGRGLWARARTVERHHQALGTLADITQRADAQPHAPTDTTTGPEHQAHVRIIGAAGPAPVPPVLPPPKPVLGPSRPSPFR